MADNRRTHKGQIIDIDLIRMKSDLERKEINNINIKREKEVDTKRRRGSAERINEMLANQEMVRQKMREKKAEDEEDDTKSEGESVDPSVVEDAPVVKDVPETTGRKVVKR